MRPAISDLWRPLRRASGVVLVLMAPLGAGAQAHVPDTGGFVIRDSLVIRRCGGCHKPDSAGRLGRLSYMRKTPEGWEASVRRMVSLVKVRLNPADARHVVKYFANRQGLAPSEIEPGRFETERRFLDYRYTADATTERTCRACHSMGRVITQRRSKEEWELLVATHRGYYPNSDFQAFRRMGPTPRDSAPQPHPMDQAVGHLSRTFPLRTREWAAWEANMRPAPMEGTWVLSGQEAGKGPFNGRLTVTKVAGTQDEFTTRATYTYAASGRTVAHEGRAVVYTGHQWRGRSAPAGTAADSAWREVMTIEPGWQVATGRWYRGGYDEFGLDVTLRRAGSAPTITAVWPRGLKAGTTTDVTVTGANLPAAPVASTIDFGPGMTVDRVVRSTGDAMVLRVRADSSATVGVRDLFVAGASMRNAVVAYRTIDRVRVSPNSHMARVGGVRFPKQFAQFEAMGMLNGPDKRPETDDDIEVGPVAATWSLEEYGVTFKDDDTRYVGQIDANGFFTPALDGPNASRAGNRNNIGDVWVVASYRDGGAAAKVLKGRSLLIVTVPLYMRWEPARTAP